MSFYPPSQRDKKIELQAEWLRLIHYQLGLFGGYHSRVEASQFFLAPEGKSSPLKELESTLEKFFVGPVDQRKKFQCAYLARRDFLVKALAIPSDELQPCPEFADWIARLDPQKINLVFVSGSIREPVSSFGHVFLKVQNPKNTGAKDLLNYGINYAARTANTQGALYTWYGLLGYFPGTYGMAPYHHMIKEYTNMEGRDLWEYELNLKPVEIERLMKHLLELEKGYFDYYFMDDNCAGMIAMALDVARPEMTLTDFAKPWVLPLDVVKEVVSAGLVVDKRFRPSLQTEFESSYKRLSLYDKLGLRELIHQTEGKDLTEVSNPLLESAQTYFALKGARDFRAYKSINYKLSLERSKRESVENERAPASVISPDHSSGTSLISLGEIHGEKYDAGFLKVRAAGYDLLTSPLATAPFSELAILSIAFQGQKWDETSLQQVQFINFLSTRAVSWIDTPLSFGFALEREQNWRLPFRVGYAFDFDLFDGIRWMNFATARVQEVFADEKWFKPGYESLLAIHVSSSLRGLVSYDGYFTGHTRDNVLKAAMVFQPLRNFEIRLERDKVTTAALGFYF